MMTGMIGVILTALLMGAVLTRVILGAEGKGRSVREDAGISQTTGRQQVQSDAAQIQAAGAGIMAVLADGIGRENTGKVCAQLAVDTVLDRFEPYRTLDNPEYFFKSTFAEAHGRIQKTIGSRRGGASLAAAFVGRTHLYYGAAGSIRIALVRRGEVIPLSRGHTLDVLAAQAYQEGRITRQEALWSMEETRVWNYLGRDGFHEIEVCQRPIRIKEGDWILLISKGVFEGVSWGEIEDIMQGAEGAQVLADRIVQTAEAKSNPEMDNGSVLLLKVKTEAADEKDKL